MIENKHVLESVMDNLSRGLIYVGADQRIGLCNQKAKEIIGIDFDRTNTHEAGVIADNDIVIIADNNLGDDDGNMEVGDLERINIRDKGIQRGDMLLGVGVYNNKKIEPIYKYMREHQLQTPFALDAMYLGFRIGIAIDLRNKVISISVDEKNFPLHYYISVGHMIVIDGTNGRIKFFQMKGYSVRKEAIATLLRGGEFLAKTSNSEDEPSVIGSKLLDIAEESELTKKVISLLQGKDEEEHVKDALYEINRRPMICSLFSSKDDRDPRKVLGVYLMIQDATEMEALLDDRNRIIEEIEKKYQGKGAHTEEYPRQAFEQFVGNGPIVQETKYLAYKASKTKFNVIITGESGTGKSILAKEIHNMQNNRGPFIEANCNAIAPSLFESELFGYVAGAFTGASIGGKAGYFEAANGGTIFLDEIGEIPLEIQVKLLHVLQNKIIYRVGSSKPIKVDVRVIAATNKNLEEEVSKGNFRQDLFYRINVFPIRIAPLRERKSDMYLLINQLLQRTCEQYDLEPKQLSGGALRKMMIYDWPGNVRELENVIERAITLCESNMIYPEHINIESDGNAKSMRELLQEEEIRILRSTLNRYNGDKQMTMEELGLSKSVFYEKCKRYGLG